MDSRRRLVQISLRTFLLLIAGIAVLTNWMINRIRLHAGQVEVAAQLANRDVDDLESRLPDHASYRGPRGHFVNVSAATGWEKHISGWLGMPYEADVKALNVHAPVDDWTELLVLIKQLPKLRNLGFTRCEIPEDVLPQLHDLSVAAIGFTNTNITKEQAFALKKAMPNTKIELIHEGPMEWVVELELP
jgi:hypothetical protein